MFHIFEGFENPEKARSQSREGRGKAGKRSSTLRACEQCRRRKIRCDGEQPCEACQWYKKTELCQYSDPRPSRRHVEKLSSTVDEYRTVFERLFPDVPLQSLSTLPRERLLELASNAGAHGGLPPASNTSTTDNDATPPPQGDDTLESLQTMPDDCTESHVSDSPDLVDTVSDDVNALSLSPKRPSTYLGISSVNAVMQVIAWIDPSSAQMFLGAPDRQLHSTKRESAFQSNSSTWPANHSSGAREANTIELIDAYFSYFHTFAPLLDEQLFRETVLMRKRCDPRWLALENIVYALGSIAAYTAEDTSHESYYLRSKHYLSLDSLGNPHLETIQTLALMGGSYLHYISQPNLAHSFIGVALRMATMLGLHKEFTGHHEPSSHQRKFSVDLRRKIWWSLLCLDTWGYMTLGRPSMGRFGPGITAKLPQYQGDKESSFDVVSLIENTRFCKIATLVGDTLAASPLVTYSEMVSLDHQLIDWYNNLPPLLKDRDPCSDTVSTTRTVMRWRYQSQRILLHRPVLLNYAIRRVPYIAVKAEERYAIEQCRIVADETIRDVASALRLNQMTGWNAVWLLFQATLVPLLGLFIADSTTTHPLGTPDNCRTQVEIAMAALSRLESWSPTARRTLEVVSTILEASQRPRTATTSSHCSEQQAPTPSTGAQLVSHSIDALGAVTSTYSMSHVAAVGPCFDGYQGIGAYMDHSPQQMLDYITWSDNMWPGTQGDFYPPQTTPVGLFSQAEEYLKPLDHGRFVAALPAQQSILRFQ
ncbi:hypothetical protein LOZ58_003269 [Ophidiomyces ophidiicola]|nr:hypothetical protein LOZ58_003269 [Ophidiomyces ophidiicola]